MRLLFGALAPDQAPHLQIGQDGKYGLQIAENVFPAVGGYRPIKGFEEVTPALASHFLGAATYKAPDGTVQLLAGTATNLYKFDSSLAWTSILGSLTAGRWFFTQFNEHVIATNGGSPVDITLAGGTAAALGGSPPASDFCATVREFVVLAADATVSWSGFEDRAQWTPGTNQSGSQPMLAGGPVTGLAGGEYGLIFQRSRITRMSYVGDPVIWQFDEISSNVGCIAAGSIVQVGRLVFFLGDRGWHVTDGNDVKPIGEERVDRSYLAGFSPSDIESSIYGCVDPKSQIVTWNMPSRQFNYHISLDQWSTGNQPVKAAFNGYTAGVDLDSLDAIYGDLDSMGTISLDDPRFAGGDPQYFFVNMSDEVGTLTGDNTAAMIEPPFVEMIPATIARVNRARPISDATDGVTILFNARMRLGDSGHSTSEASMRNNGDIPCRVSGRFIRPKVTIDAGTTWSYLQGIDFDTVAAGGRQ